MSSTRSGQILFGIASASLALWSLAYSHVASQSLPDWFPWRDAWVYASASLILVSSVCLLLSRTALWSALVISAYQAISALIYVPQIFSNPLSVDAWYPCCQALTSLSGIWVLYCLLEDESRGIRRPRTAWTGERAAHILFGFTCIFYGLSHFVYADYTASMVPTWLPSGLAFAYFTGLCHVAAGLAIIIGILPRIAATLEATMMSLFGLLVWVPSFFIEPPPAWARPPAQQYSELAVTFILASSAWIVSISLRDHGWLSNSMRRLPNRSVVHE